MPRADTTDTLHTVTPDGTVSNAQLHADIMAGVEDDTAAARAFALAQGLSVELADVLYPQQPPVK